MTPGEYLILDRFAARLQWILAVALAVNGAAFVSRLGSYLGWWGWWF